MTVTELIRKIKEFPKVTEKFYDWLCEFEYNTDWSFFPDNGLSIDNQGNKVQIPFTMLYGLLEEFFWGNGVLLHNILNDLIEKSNKKRLRIDLWNIDQYNKIKQQAILKACEIKEALL